MSRFVDAIIVYRILKKLATPFNETEAYRRGIIDDKGKILRKFSSLDKEDDRNAYTLLDRLVWRIKRMIERIPNDNRKLASFAAALALIKEHADAEHEPMPSEFEHQLKHVMEHADIDDEMLMVENYFETGTLTGGVRSFRLHLEEEGMSVGAGFSGQATPNPNPNLAGRDILLGKGKIQRRKKPNAK
jgi:hypothetical protein